MSYKKCECCPITLSKEHIGKHVYGVPHGICKVIQSGVIELKLLKVARTYGTFSWPVGILRAKYRLDDGKSEWLCRNRPCQKGGYWWFLSKERAEDFAKNMKQGAAA